MAILDFLKSREEQPRGGALAAFLQGASIEVMPRTAAKVEDFRAILPAGTRVYVAHIEGTPIEEMVATVARLRDEGFAPMPHIPARIIPDRATLESWLKRYREEGGAEEALVLAGSPTTPLGELDSAIALLQTGLFETLGYRRLHVAGHPEGNKDIDPAGGTKNVDEAVLWKQRYAAEHPVEMAIVTQFVFDAAPVIAWADRLAGMGVTLPIHVGVAGPAKLQTLIKYAIACGVGPSLAVLQRRAADLTKLLLPFEPTEVMAAVGEHKAAHPESLIASAHIFPLGGIKASADWLATQKGGQPS